MLSHDQLVFAVNKRHPDLVHGRDFWVAHPVKAGSAEQIGEAEILSWPKGLQQPDRASLVETFQLHAAEFHMRARLNHTQRARLERNARLAASDWTQLPDVPPTLRKAWQPYRQALRDLPQQAGFPVQIVWPKPPAD